MLGRDAVRFGPAMGSGAAISTISITSGLLRALGSS
jgi:hypothetical protein